MDLFRGAKGDKPRGGGAYVKEEGFGHEVFNFLPDGHGVYRGYVRPPGQGPVRDQRINIDRLGASESDDHLDGVDVFWAATHPALGGTRVVGWYDDATVFRTWRPSPKKRPLPNGDDAGFMIEATSVRLLPTDDRLFTLPRASAKQTGIGQSNLWYAPPEWAEKLLEYKKRVQAGGRVPGPKKVGRPKLGRTSDTEARLRIEREAMQATIAWCEERSLPWNDVSLGYLGWDIQAGEGKGILRIEVKGSSRPIGEALLELTPNEFAKMAEYRESFRLAVVSLAGRRPTLLMFGWSADARAWIADAGAYTLKLHEVLSARVEVCWPA